ncbi:MAG: alpha/beta hydrolase [Ruminococcus sp.]|nr:alpha/beta hydrolase [Ruminococcus sp.]
MKKVLKIIGRILLVLLIIFILLTIVCFFIDKSARKKDAALLEKDGFVNLVSAGDYKMNVNIYGDGKTKIVAMPGSGDSGFSVDMKKFSEHLDDDISLIVVSRPGYGITEETKSKITTEYIVESTRTALKNAGVEAPYILMPHSLSGIYGTYWENTYPDELSGVIFLDSITSAEDEIPEHGVPRFMQKAGMFLFRFYHHSGLSRAVDAISGGDSDDEYAKDYEAFYNVQQMRSFSQEILNYNAIMRTAWSSIKANDIPKIYITTEYETLDDIKEMYKFYDSELDEEEANSIYESEVTNQSEWKKDHIKKRDEYIENVGNCEKINIPGSHFIYEQKPDELAKVIENFITKNINK